MGSPKPRVGGTLTLSIAPSEPAGGAEEFCSPVTICRTGSPGVRQSGTSHRNADRAAHRIMFKSLTNY
jgi:hypothetical protein